MTLNQLKYILEVSKHKSFSRASEFIGITQPALTLQIKNFEEEIGFLVFDRTKKPLLVTKEGGLILERASQILKLADDLHDIAFELGEEVNGILKIGIIPTLAPYLLPVFIDELNSTYPNMRLSIKELITEQVIANIKGGELDAGIIATPVKAKGIELKTLFYEKFYLFISDKNELYNLNSVAIDEIQHKDLWYLSEGNCFQNQVNAICKLSDSLINEQKFKYQSNSIESLRYIVEHRGGLAFIPELATLTIPSEKEDMIKEIEGLQPVREISIVTTRFAAKRKLIEAFQEVLIKSLPGRMKTLRDNMIMDTRVVVD